jgi:hypothetical protein
MTPQRRAGNVCVNSERLEQGGVEATEKLPSCAVDNAGARERPRRACGQIPNQIKITAKSGVPFAVSQEENDDNLVGGGTDRATLLSLYSVRLRKEVDQRTVARLVFTG